MTSLSWVESSGGPLIVMHRSQLRTWWGAFGPQQDRDIPSSGKTDYARACDIETEIGVLGLAAPQILVMGDEPDRTTARIDGTTIFLLRWRAATSEVTLMSDFENLSANLTFEPAGTFETDAGEHLMFDAANVGWQPGNSLRIDLGATRYAIGTALLLTDQTELLVHRLVPT